MHVHSTQCIYVNNQPIIDVTKVANQHHVYIECTTNIIYIYIYIYIYSMFMCKQQVSHHSMEAHQNMNMSVVIIANGNALQLSVFTSFWQVNFEAYACLNLYIGINLILSWI